MIKKINYIILIILVALNITFSVYSVVQSKKYSYIIFDEKNIWKFNDNNAKKTANFNIKRLNYTSAKIYNQDKYDGYYSKDENLKIYTQYLELSDKKPEAFIVIGNNDVTDYTNNITDKIDETDELIVQEWLEENNIDYAITDIYIKRANITNSKKIYSIEPYVLNGILENGFSNVFIYDNGQYNLIYEKPSNPKDNRSSSLRNIIDIDNDENLEIILLSDIPGSAGNECYSLYKYNESSKKYEPKIDCED